MVVGARKSASSAARAMTAAHGVRGVDPPLPNSQLPPGLDPDLLATIQRLEMAEFSEEGGREYDSEEGVDKGRAQQPQRVTNYEDLLPPAVDDMGSGERERERERCEGGM